MVVEALIKVVQVEFDELKRTINHLQARIEAANMPAKSLATFYPTIHSSSQRTSGRLMLGGNWTF